MIRATRRAGFSVIMIGVSIVGAGLLYFGVTSESQTAGFLGAGCLISAVMWFGHNDTHGRERPNSRGKSHNPALDSHGGSDGCD